MYHACWGCGIPVPCESDKPVRRVWCPDCTAKHQREAAERREQLASLKLENRLESALACLEEQQLPIGDYREAFDVVSEAARRDRNRFQSTGEVIAAMELLRNHLHIKTQQEIAGHRVDFTVPSLKAVLEVDGVQHRLTLAEDRDIDVKVRTALGADWEVVRIPEEYVRQNTARLVPAIKALTEYRRKVRRENGGMIPAWMSSRDEASWKRILTKLRGA